MALESLGLVLPNRMHERVIYSESFAHGKTAFEIEPKGIAAQELAAIWSGVKERIHENENSGKQEITKGRIPA
jgi:chromosome partitioning protein